MINNTIINFLINLYFIENIISKTFKITKNYILNLKLNKCINQKIFFCILIFFTNIIYLFIYILHQ